MRLPHLLGRFGSSQAGELHDRVHDEHGFARRARVQNQLELRQLAAARRLGIGLLRSRRIGWPIGGVAAHWRTLARRGMEEGPRPCQGHLPQPDYNEPAAAIISKHRYSGKLGRGKTPTVPDGRDDPGLRDALEVSEAAA